MSDLLTVTGSLPINSLMLIEGSGSQAFTAFIKYNCRSSEGYELKEPQSPYNHVFDPEKCRLRLKNDNIWQVS
jgi:hypothetical protein